MSTYNGDLPDFSFLDEYFEALQGRWYKARLGRLSNLAYGLYPGTYPASHGLVEVDVIGQPPHRDIGVRRKLGKLSSVETNITVEWHDLYGFDREPNVRATQVDIIGEEHGCELTFSTVPGETNGLKMGAVIAELRRAQAAYKASNKDT